MVKILADSTCDLSEELTALYDVDILPLHILLGTEDYLDGREISPDDIYKWADAHMTTPKTSAPSIEEAITLLQPYVGEGREVVCFAISEDMSASANVMRLAARELDAEDRISVIDSCNLSTGIGLLVIEASIMARKGWAASQITAEIEMLKPLVRASFVVDTLTYLYRGGRCTGLTALLGSALKIHPKIVVEDGKMHPAKKYRGQINNVVFSYADDLKTQLKNAKTDRVFITHSGCREDIIESIFSYLENLHIFSEILVTRAGGVISSHCGPGTLGILFISNEIS